MSVELSINRPPPNLFQEGVVGETWGEVNLDCANYTWYRNGSRVDGLCVAVPVCRGVVQFGVPICSVILVYVECN